MHGYLQNAYIWLEFWTGGGGRMAIGERRRWVGDELSGYGEGYPLPAIVSSPTERAFLCHDTGMLLPMNKLCNWLILFLM